MVRSTTAEELFSFSEGEASLAEQLLTFLKGMKVDGYQVQCRAFKVLIAV